MGCGLSVEQNKVFPVITVTQPREPSFKDSGKLSLNPLDSRLVEVGSMSIQCDWLDEYEMHMSK